MKGMEKKELEKRGGKKRKKEKKGRKRREKESTHRINALYWSDTHSTVTPGVTSTDTFPNSSCVSGLFSSPYAWTRLVIGQKQKREREREKEKRKRKNSRI